MSHVSKKKPQSKTYPERSPMGCTLSKDNPVHEGAGGGGSNNVLELNQKKKQKKERERVVTGLLHGANFKVADPESLTNAAI